MTTWRRIIQFYEHDVELIKYHREEPAKWTEILAFAEVMLSSIPKIMAENQLSLLQPFLIGKSLGFRIDSTNYVLVIDWYKDGKFILIVEDATKRTFETLSIVEQEEVKYDYLISKMCELVKKYQIEPT